VQCNRHLKFTHLLQRARQLGARWVATGHYASVESGEDGRYYLRRGRDASKDQSYFLFDMTQEQLRQTLLPLGTYYKEEVRAMAARWQLNVATKADSQEICFIPDGDYRTFLRTRLGPEEAQPGQMVNAAGEVVGEHRGLPFYTIGQRRGLGVAAGHPLYVTQVQPENNVLVVGSRQEAMSETFTVERLNWLCPPPMRAMQTTVQIRYRHQPVAARVEPSSGDRARIVLQAPQFAVTPGQAAVFYEGATVMGGGWICRSVGSDG
jgi:tRNA-specific 2-thiouridylase